jgi:hypothetical protein
MQHDFVLLDRSGSMGTIWDEALSSVNAYVKKLASDNVDTGVTLATFDTNANDSLAFEIIRDRITPQTWRPVSSAECEPRGLTPLNDATVRIVSLAEACNFDRVAIIIMTDGAENASRELPGYAGVVKAKAALDRCRAKGWQVIFLGANFDNASQGAMYGNAAHGTVCVDSANLQASGTTLASKRAVYGATGASMSFSDKEKAELSKKSEA